MRISVIIPTRDGHGPLRNCLAALAADFPADAETIVVSDGGSLNLDRYLCDFREALRLTCLRVDRGGPAHARNAGLARAQGDVIAFTDDDCRPRGGWVRAIAAGVTTSPAHASGGVTCNGKPHNACAETAQMVLDLVAQHEKDSCGEVRFFPSNNCAFPAEPLRRLGGFDARYKTAEDRELLRRWRSAGFTMSIAPAAIVDHDADPDLPTFTRKFFHYGRGAALFHATDTDRSARDSASFHRRLPTLVRPYLKDRGFREQLRLLGLLGVWEIANAAGFLAASVDSGAHGTNPREQ